MSNDNREALNPEWAVWDQTHATICGYPDLCDEHDNPYPMHRAGQPTNDRDAGSEYVLRSSVEGDLILARNQAARAAAALTEVRAAINHLPHTDDCRFPDTVCDCRTIELREVVHRALDGDAATPDTEGRA